MVRWFFLGVVEGGVLLQADQEPYALFIELAEQRVVRIAPIGGIEAAGLHELPQFVAL